MPGSKIAYLVGETEDGSCALPGTARTARPSSPSSSTSSTKSTRSTAAQEPLPPSDKRSSSPDLIVTNGSTLCAQYRQRTADFDEREDDRVSRSTNVCGPITAANRLSQQRKLWEKIGISGEPTEEDHH